MQKALDMAVAGAGPAGLARRCRRAAGAILAATLEAELSLSLQPFGKSGQTYGTVAEV